MLSAMVLFGPTAVPYNQGWRATGHPVICLPLKQFDSYAASVGDLGASDLWLPNFKIILMTGGKWSDCWDLMHPYADDPLTTELAVFVLGHEAAHARQQELGLPFNEHQADCWSMWGQRRLRRKLGIHRLLPFLRVRGC